MDPSATRVAWAPAPAGRTARRTVAWALLRDLLQDVGHPRAVLRNPCPRCDGPHGPVQVIDAPWRASVSYAGTLAVAAIHPDVVAAFAIDAEPLHDPVRTLAGPVPGGLLHWVRAEAVLKADGRGVGDDAAPVEIVEIVETADGWAARIPDSGVRYTGGELAGPAGVLVCAAVA